MNHELSLNLQDLELILNKSHCSCHFINPNKTRLILWKEEKGSVVTYYLRIGIQKFISYPLTDKNGESYWRFKPWEKTVAPISDPVINDPDPVTKFHQRQAKTQALNDANNSPETNSRSQ